MIVDLFSPPRADWIRATTSKTCDVPAAIARSRERSQDGSGPGRVGARRIQFPELEDQPFLDRLNELASQLGDRLRNFNDGRDFVETAQRYLFEELGFHGNEEDYLDPLNSCLNQVLERRTGIPITLSVMYMEIARRLQMPVFGIGLPRHFVIQFDDGNYATYIDPFHGGRTITPRECFALAGAQVPDLALLRRVSKKEIVMRMLQNLRGAYLRAQDWATDGGNAGSADPGFSSRPAVDASETGRPR